MDRNQNETFEAELDIVAEVAEKVKGKAKLSLKNKQLLEQLTKIRQIIDSIKQKSVTPSEMDELNMENQASLYVGDIGNYVELN